MKQYKAPNAELLLFAADDILKESDEFQLSIDWFGGNDLPQGGSDLVP